MPSVPFDLAATAPAIIPRSLTARPPCAASDDGETITVCARRQDFRLPLPVERAATDPDARIAGDMPSAAASLVPAGRCGIFPGERPCRKSEAARYGYGAGRDPLTLLGKLASKAIDPDAE